MNPIANAYSIGLTRPERDTFFYLLGRTLEKLPLPTPAFLEITLDLDNAYKTLDNLLRLHLITGNPRKYTIPKKILDALSSSGNAPVRGSDPSNSVLSLLKYFREQHARFRKGKATVKSNDLVCMRGLCRKVPPTVILAEIYNFFQDPTEQGNLYASKGVADFERFLLRTKILERKEKKVGKEKKRK